MHSNWYAYRSRRRWLSAVLWSGLALLIVINFGVGEFRASPWFYACAAAWFLAFMVTLTRLLAIKYPRCNQTFFRRLLFCNPFARQCLHCGLPKHSDPDGTPVNPFP